MNKNNQPYSVDRNVHLALDEEFNTTGTMHNQFFCDFKKSCNWHPVPEVPGTLSVTCTQLEGNKLHRVEASFRVSFASLENSNELDFYRGNAVLLKYDSAGGKTKVAGTKMHPLTVVISEPEGFDGYEIKLSGTQDRPESFI
jgi:hypothetical protein